MSRSVSSVGEHQSETYVSPTLPKRAETFGGFDNPLSGVPKAISKKLQNSSGSPAGSPDLDNLKPGDSRIFVSEALQFLIFFNNCNVLMIFRNDYPSDMLQYPQP